MLSFMLRMLKSKIRIKKFHREVKSLRCFTSWTNCTGLNRLKLQYTNQARFQLTFNMRYTYEFTNQEYKTKYSVKEISLLFDCNNLRFHAYLPKHHQGYDKTPVKQQNLRRCCIIQISSNQLIVPKIISFKVQSILILASQCQKVFS